MFAPETPLEVVEVVATLPEVSGAATLQEAVSEVVV